MLESKHQYSYTRYTMIARMSRCKTKKLAADCNLPTLSCPHEENQKKKKKRDEELQLISNFLRTKSEEPTKRDVYQKRGSNIVIALKIRKRPSHLLPIIKDNIR